MVWFGIRSDCYRGLSLKNLLNQSFAVEFVRELSSRFEELQEGPRLSRSGEDSRSRIKEE